MRDDLNSSSGQHLITTRVIKVVVTVDGELDWELCDRLNLGNQLFDCHRRKESVEDEHAVSADYKSRIAGRESARLGDHCVNAVGNFDDLKVVFRFRRTGCRLCWVNRD